MPDVAFQTVELDEDVEDPLDAVLDKLPAELEGPVMVLGLERSNPSNAEKRPALYALNLGRAEWIERLPQPVVFWIPEYLLGLMGREAPDFLDWRSDTISFPVEDEEILVSSFESWDAVSMGDLSREQRGRRIEELQSRLAGLPGSNDPNHAKARYEWLQELALHHDFLGELEDAQRYYEQALKWARTLQKPSDVAGCLLELWRLAVDLGETQNQLELETELDSIKNQLQASPVLRDKKLLVLLDPSGLGSFAEDPSLAALVQLREKIRKSTDEKVDLSAREKLAEELLTASRVRDKHVDPAQLLQVARIKFELGDLAHAEELLQEALSITKSSGARPIAAEVVYWLAGIALMKEQVAVARSRLIEARDEFRAMGMRPWLREVDNKLALVEELQSSK